MLRVLILIQHARFMIYCKSRIPSCSASSCPELIRKSAVTEQLRLQEAQFQYNNLTGCFKMKFRSSNLVRFIFTLVLHLEFFFCVFFTLQLSLYQLKYIILLLKTEKSTCLHWCKRTIFILQNSFFFFCTCECKRRRKEYIH